MSDARDAWSESRLERQSAMSPHGIASRQNDDPPDVDPVAPRPRRPRRRGWTGVALGGAGCIALAGLAFYALRRLLHG